jgi:hypothetical protein
LASPPPIDLESASPTFDEQRASRPVFFSNSLMPALSLQSPSRQYFSLASASSSAFFFFCSSGSAGQFCAA